MIEDPELKGLFQAENEERLHHLEDGLRELKDKPFNQELIEGMFRDAHTIKGAARMFDIISIEKIAHQMEELLDVVRRKKYGLTPSVISYFYEAIDAIRALVIETTEGTSSNINVDVILRGLNVKDFEKQSEKKPPESDVFQPAPIQPPIVQEEPKPVPLKSSQEEKLKEQTEEKKIQRENKGEIEAAKILHRVASLSLHSPTIRIQAEQLNELMVQAGNLTVSRNRIDAILEQIDQLISHLEEISRQESWQPFVISKRDIVQSEQQRARLQRERFEHMTSLIDKLNHLRNAFADDFFALGEILASMSDRIRMLGLIPLSNLFDLFPRMVSELASASGKKVDFSIIGGEITVEKRIIEEMKDSIMHILRNAISHGIEFPEERESLGKERQGKIELKASQTPNRIIIEISDDGRGLDLEKIKQVAIKKNIASQEQLEAMSISEIQSLIFVSGFSTTSSVTEISGRGVGMDVVRSKIEKLNGVIQIKSESGKGLQIFIQLPITLVTTHVLLVEVKGNIYAIPIDMIEACALISSHQLFTIEGREIICFDDQPISIALLADLLNIPSQENIRKQEKLSCVILKLNEKRVATLVDAILEEQQVVVNPPNFFFGEVRALAGTTILKTGKVCIVLNVYDLIKDVDKGILTSISAKNKLRTKDKERKKQILCVDDSYTMRIIMKKVLEEEGFHVILAENGIDALTKLNQYPFIDAVVTDLEMPKMNGIALIKKIRLMQDFYALPIILFTSLKDEEQRKQGLEVGATFYLVKSEYNQDQLIQTLQELLFP